MDIVKENIVKFIDCIIVEDYSKAHSFLEVVINEKVKSRIRKAAKQNPFVKGAEESSKKSAFGGKFSQANSENHKKKLVSEQHSPLIKLMDELPDGSHAAAAVFHFMDYGGDGHPIMYKVVSSGRLSIEELDGLYSEVLNAKKIAEKQGLAEDADDFEQLLKELDRIQQKYTPQEENI
jgi:hypothetical protein